MTHLPTRQVHLDFHTSPHIPDLLSEWDADVFADTMKEAHVNSVTVFAKGHHGMSYYPTKLGQPHPALGGVDLLGETIEALRQRDIHTPIYYTVGWEERLAYARPEWRQVKQDGEHARQTAAPGQVDPSKWWFMSFLHPDYQAYMTEEVEEIAAAYPVEGVFFDICFYHPEAGFSDAVRKVRREHGLEAYTPEAQLRFRQLAKELFAAKMTPLVQAQHPQARCFYNSAHHFSVESKTSLRAMNAYQQHWEIESLPSGFWGYYHFPRFARYVSTFEMPWLGMTGRFQRMWGDFGGIKPQAALEFECFRSQAHGGTNSVGDQLPPRGKLDSAAYQLIGSVYEQVKAAEPFYEGSQALFDTGILLASHPSLPAEPSSLSEEGAVLMLEEAHYHPAVLDDASDLSLYKAVLLPDTTLITAELYDKLKAYYEAGGNLILSYRSGRDAEGNWQLDFLPLTFHGASDMRPTYWRCTTAFWSGQAQSDRVFYEAGLDVSSDAAETIVERVLPYFQRTDEHFMSHFQAPPVAEASGHPAVLLGERFAYFADPVFRAYRYYGATFYRDVVERVLERLVGPPLVGKGLARTVLSLPRRRGDDLIVTLLHYVPLRKAIEGDVLEEAMSFAEEKLTFAALPDNLSVRQFGGGALQGGALQDGESSYDLPAVKGRLLLECPDYFKKEAK